MKEKLGAFLRKIVFAFGLLYGINVCLKTTNVMIPINIATLTITILLGVPGLISIFAIFYLTK